MLHPTITEDYPDAPAKFQERFRGVHELQRDETAWKNAWLVSCAAAACPAHASILKAANENTDELRISGGEERYAKVYNIDYNRCIFWRLWRGGLPHRTRSPRPCFEIASYNTSTLIYRKEQSWCPFLRVRISR